MAEPTRRRQPGRAAVVLVFGESRNDRLAIVELIEALCPELAGLVRERPHPVSLNRSASQRSVSSWIERIADAVSSHDKPVVCVFVHRDADGPDPGGQLHQQTEVALRHAGIIGAHAVVPVEEIEAWWMLFPDATERLRRSWRGRLQRANRDWDTIRNPKEELKRLTRRGDRRHPYSEADSPSVARHIAAAIAAGTTTVGRSRSYERFAVAVGKCCNAA
ncbi:MAG: hypothetical protein F4017_02340 [Acidimicrobiaceae bacterium]|nr:hypothetical protein [Acidimicrobiaceae bacterium]